MHAGENEKRIYKDMKWTWKHPCENALSLLIWSCEVYIDVH